MNGERGMRADFAILAPCCEHPLLSHRADYGGCGHINHSPRLPDPEARCTNTFSEALALYVAAHIEATR